MNKQIEYDRKAIDKALIFAAKAHDGQVRKYTGEPYVQHPLAVALKMMEIGADQNMVIAALLHDTVEDTDVTLWDIEANFGEDVLMLVEQLTDVSHADDGLRKQRKAIDREHTAKASVRAKTIKLADVIDNTTSIIQHSKEFAKVYLAEKELLLEVLKEGDERLYAFACNLVEEGKVLIRENPVTLVA